MTSAMSLALPVIKMRTERISRVLKAALIAGLAAGLVMSLFHFLFTEGLIDQAIALEPEAAFSGPFSRDAQKAMLVVGGGLYGLVVGAIFAVAFTLLERLLPGHRPGTKAMWLAAVLWWSLGLLTQLKYPATLPGGGNPETVYVRQALQFGFAGLSILAVVIAWLAYHFLGKLAGKVPRQWRLGMTVVLYGVMLALSFILMPAIPRYGPAPDDLVIGYRNLSLLGQALFWATLGGVLALLLRRLQRERKRDPTGPRRKAA